MTQLSTSNINAVADLKPGYKLGAADVALLQEMARRLLAVEGREPVAYMIGGHYLMHSQDPKVDNYASAVPLYPAPPAPVAQPVQVPEPIEMDDDFDSAFEHGKAVGWNACRAAMLKGVGHVCHKCGGTGMADSGGVQPWGAEILIPCDCTVAAPVVDADDNFYSWFGREWHENYQQNQYTAAAKQMLGVMAESAWRAGKHSAMLQPSSGALQLREGYVLVPVEPTIAILDEFDSIIDYGAEDSKDAWSRLLAAAWVKSLPAAPQEPTK